VRARLRRSIEVNLWFIVENRAHVNAVHRIVENRTADTGVVADGVPDVMPSLVAALRSAQESGDLGDFDPLVAAFIIRAVIDAASYYLTANGSLDVDHLIGEAVTLLDRAIAPGIPRKEPK
jgi:hypothetical protein